MRAAALLAILYALMSERGIALLPFVLVAMWLAAAMTVPVSIPAEGQP